MLLRQDPSFVYTALYSIIQYCNIQDVLTATVYTAYTAYNMSDSPFHGQGGLMKGLVKGPWTKEEDQKIIDCITQNITKWSEIAERVEGRVGKQCRERWFNHLDPSLKKSSWTLREDEILVQGQARFGNRSGLSGILGSQAAPMQ